MLQRNNTLGNVWKLLYLEYRLELEYNSSFGILALKAVEWSKGEIVGDESSRGYWNWNFQWNDFRMATDLFLGRLQ